MKIQVIVGDILKSKSQTLINTVNCEGVMGKGIALEFKKQFPDMYKDYAERCKNGQVRLGQPYIYKTLYPPHIINFPTKDHWRSVSRVEDIKASLEYLKAHIKEWGVESLAIPPLGCGNGQLEWRIVGPLIYKNAKEMEIPVELYAPYGAPSNELTASFLESEGELAGTSSVRFLPQTLNPAWIALVEVLHRIEQQPYHWPVGRTIFQKIAYVATREGLKTGLNHRRGSFGPFSDNLKSVFGSLVNANLLQEERLGKMFRIKTGPNFHDQRRNFLRGISQWEEIIHKTADLFMRMNTDQAEVVSTVLFAADEIRNRENRTPSEGEALEAVLQWKQKRRPPLNREIVASTIRNLGILKWLHLKFDPSLPVTQEELAA